MEYLHGAYAVYDPSGLSVPSSSGTLPVYFGLAPVHQLEDYEGLAGLPILLNSRSRMLAAMGYSDDWRKFSLCEPAYLHFLSAEPVGPIAVVNALNPDVHRKSAVSSAEAVFIAGEASLNTSTAITGTVRLSGGEGASLTAAYDETGMVMRLTDSEGLLSGTHTVEFYEADPDAVTPAAMAALIRDATGMIYERTGMVPAILCAPGWHDTKAVNDALKGAAKSINGHWNAFVFSDISSGAGSVSEAMALKESELRNASIESPCWPAGTDGERYYHLSALAAHRSQLVDRINGDVPYETTSNKRIAITGLAVSDGSGGYKPLIIDKLEGNTLNASGIKTAIFWGGTWRLWGPHTGAYNHSASNLPEEIFDSGVRMTQYLGNSFQLAYGDEVGKPMHRARIDSILDAEQERLDRLVNNGALLFGQIDFIPAGNPDSDLMTGEFVFNTGYTTTPPARAIINRYRYTATGLELLASGGEE